MKMISKAVAKYIRISPRKTRLVIAHIKGKSAVEATGILENMKNRAAGIICKVLKSAIANAKRFPNLTEEELYISDVHADGGPTLKRFRADAMGRASVLRKPTAHITIVLDIVKSTAVSAKGKQAEKKQSALKEAKPAQAGTSKRKVSKARQAKGKAVKEKVTKS